VACCLSRRVAPCLIRPRSSGRWMADFHCCQPHAIAAARDPAPLVAALALTQRAGLPLYPLCRSRTLSTEHASPRQHRKRAASTCEVQVSGFYLWVGLGECSAPLGCCSTRGAAVALRHACSAARGAHDRCTGHGGVHKGEAVQEAELLGTLHCWTETSVLLEEHARAQRLKGSTPESGAGTCTAMPPLPACIWPAAHVARSRPAAAAFFASLPPRPAR
jgi:hypothetical protein